MSKPETLTSSLTPIQFASQRPCLDPVSRLQFVMAHPFRRRFTVGIERRDFPEFYAEQARPSSRLRSMYFVHSEQCVLIDAEPQATLPIQSLRMSRNFKASA